MMNNSIPLGASPQYKTSLGSINLESQEASGEASKEKSAETGEPQDIYEVAKEAAAGVSEKLKKGEKATITVEDNKIIVEKKGSDFWQKAKTGTLNALDLGSGMLKAVAQEDMSITVQAGSKLITSQYMETLREGVVPQGFEKIYNPVLRGVITAIDADKAIKSFKNPDVSTLDRIVNTTRVATDVAGLLSYAAPLLTRLPIPGIAGVAAALAVGETIAVAGDIIGATYSAVKLGSKGLDFIQEQKDKNDLNQKQPLIPSAPPESDETAGKTIEVSK